MKDKRFLLGLLAIALAFGITAGGCEIVQLVAFERADAVKNVEVNTYTVTGVGGSGESEKGVSIRWDAAKNAVSYDVYVQDEYMIDIYYVSSVRPPETSYSFTGGFYGRVRFGVTATDWDTNHAVSDIVWSEYITLASGPSDYGPGGGYGPDVPGKGQY
jgi:hypothetical protein